MCILLINRLSEGVRKGVRKCMYVWMNGWMNGWYCIVDEMQYYEWG